jgi:hypothetical protein
MCMCVYVCVCVCVCMCVCVCVHTYLYILYVWQLACVSLTHALNNDPEQRGSPFLDAMQVNLFSFLVQKYKY